MAQMKLTNDQRKKLVESYYFDRKTMAVLAKEYGISEHSVSALINSPKWIRHMQGKIADMKAKSQIKRDIVQMKAVEAAPVALDRIIELSQLELTPENMPYSYLVQNASVDLLNRAGVKPQDEGGDREITIRFADGQMPFDPGMPESGGS